MLPAIGLCNALLRMSNLHWPQTSQESRLECQSSLFRHRPIVSVFEVMQQSLLSWLTVPLAVLAYRGLNEQPYAHMHDTDVSRAVIKLRMSRI